MYKKNAIKSQFFLAIKYLFFSLRPRHWIKNGVIFLPLVFGQELFAYRSDLKVIIAFFLFSLASSIGYLINDILDIQQDKMHPTKRLRPIASGKVTITQAKITAVILAILSIPFSFLLNSRFGWIIICYLLLGIIYSKFLKSIVVIDVFCISGFFLLRIFAGCVIAQVIMSHWIIIIVALLALFLGFNKRRQELRLCEHRAILYRYVLAKYNVYFLDQMIAVITPSLVTFYTLYTVDARTVNEFGTYHLLYTIPFVYYGIFRYLYLIHKLKKEGDPTRLLFMDRGLRLVVFLWLTVCIIVIYFKV